MEDDSLQQHHLESARFPVKGMESVLATVSGYHGSERFNLIRLISRTGASYIGNMNQSVTHLVCWKFEGRKYELAKKLKIVIVNHCWIEECVKKGTRVSEEPYTIQSGEEMGPLILDILLGINQAKCQSKALRKAKGPVVDTDCEDVNNDLWTDSILFDENLFTQPRQNIHCSNRSIGKAIKRNSRKDCPSSSRYHFETISGSKIMEFEEASTSQPAYSCRLKKRNATSPEPQSKSHRLVKKHTSMKDWLLTSNMKEEREEDNTDAHDDVEEIEHVNDENQNAHAHGAPSSLPTSEELHEAAHVDLTEVDPVDRLPASSELSCVICWTDFSSSRGVLPCGHRFCFSCIQNWADHMTLRRKPSTCPLCKASFICITKLDDAVSSDQKIYSQSIPNDSSKMDLYILPDETYGPQANLSAQVCCRCSSREPEDLLIRCHFCQIRCVHSYCLDPPLFPWTCVHCKELQMLYLHSR